MAGYLGGGGWEQVVPTASVTHEQIAAMSREERQAIIEKYAASMKAPEAKGLLGPDGQPGKEAENAQGGQWFPPSDNMVVSMQRRAGQIAKGVDKLISKANGKSRRKSQGGSSSGSGGEDAGDSLHHGVVDDDGDKDSIKKDALALDRTASVGDGCSMTTLTDDVPPPYPQVSTDAELATKQSASSSTWNTATSSVEDVCWMSRRL